MATVSTRSTSGDLTCIGPGSTRDGAMNNGGDSGTRHVGGSMHPAPSLIEAPPTKSSRSGYTRSHQHPLQILSRNPMSPGLGSGNSVLLAQHVTEHISGREAVPPSLSPSPPLRKDTQLSTSTTTTNATSNSLASAATAASPTSTASPPPSIPGQTLFSINNSDASQGKRPNRRRTGPLLPEQREKAAIIRKMGACEDCRRRRVGCQPGHHNMSWDMAYERFGPDTRSNRKETSPPSPVREVRSANVAFARKRSFQELADGTPPQLLSEQPASKVRKPLPSAPRLERTAQVALSLSPDIGGNSGEPGPSMTSPGSADPPSPQFPSLSMSGHCLDAQDATASAASPISRTLTGSELQRYVAVHALLLYWEDESLDEVKRVTDDLRTVLQEQYHYACDIDLIPSDTGPFAASKWLSDRLDRFHQHTNKPNILKIIYYNGRSYIDRDREMILASSLDTDRRCEIKWKNVQNKLEAAVADTLIMMDCPYIGPRANMQNGVMTVMASCDFNDYGVHPVPRCFFSHRVVDTLRKYARQTFRGPSHTTGLVADIMNEYLWRIPDARTDQEILTTFPYPLHHVLSGDAEVPIMLAPISRTGSQTPAAARDEQRSMNLKIDFDANESLDMDDIIKWIRRLPRGVLNVRLDVPSL